jgi:exonuclease SbcD
VIILHASDLHYCPRHLAEVDRCFGAAVDEAVRRGCDLAVLCGDTFDQAVELHHPCVAAVLRQVRRLADAMPVLILQGTLSHDTPGALEVFRVLGGRHPVQVADAIGQVAWVPGAGWVASEGFAFQAPPPGAAALLSCLPAVNKGALVASGRDAAEVGDAVAAVLAGWAPVHLAARATGVPALVVAHGTVSGSVSEQGVPMAGLDHDLTTGALWAAEACAALLGHIHKHQAWARDGRLIAYPGSVGRLHFGELDPKGVLFWEVHADGASAQLWQTPAKRLLQAEFDGPPDPVALACLAAECAGAHVRVRWQIDEEHRASIDPTAIRALFAGAAELKLEGRVLPVSRQRAAGIGAALTVADKLARWCAATGTEPAPLAARLAALESAAPEEILRQITAGPPALPQAA